MVQNNTAIEYSYSSKGSTSDNTISVLGKSQLEMQLNRVTQDKKLNESHSFNFGNVEILDSGNVEPFKSSSIKTINKTENKYIESPSNFTPIAKWEGIVTYVDVEKKKFYGELKDILNYDNRIITAEFDFDDVEDAKQSLIKNNSVFYWNIFNELSSSGKRSGINCIYFRETLPIWKNFDFDDITPEIEDIHKAIFDDNTTK